MGARIGQEIQMFGAVVDGVKAPQPWDFMAEPMSPVSTDFADQQAQQQFGPQRQAGQGGGDGLRQQALSGYRDQRQGQGQQDGRQQAAEEIKAQVAEQFAFRASRVALAEK